MDWTQALTILAGLATGLFYVMNRMDSHRKDIMSRMDSHKRDTDQKIEHLSDNLGKVDNRPLFWGKPKA